MARRFRIKKDPTMPYLMFEIQEYGSERAHYASALDMAFWVTDHIQEFDGGGLKVPLIEQPEDTCPECGRRTATHESVRPGGATYTETCTNCGEEVGSWSV